MTVLGNGSELTVQEVLDRWANAIGGRELLAQTMSSRSVSSLSTSGLTGTVEQWSAADGRTRTRVDLANSMYVQDIIWRGDSCWTRDIKGNVLAIQGTDLERELTSRYLSLNRQFLDSCAYTRMIPATGDDTGFIVLEIQPPGGQAVTYYLDSKSYLPMRTTALAEDRISTTTFADWKEFGGFMVPTAIRQSQSQDTIHDAVITVQTVEMDVAIPDEVFALTVAVTKDYSFAEGNAARNVPFELSSNHIYVPVTVNGKVKKWFILDTGAEMTVLNRRTADELGLAQVGTLEGRGSGEGTVNVALVSGVTFELQGVELHDQSAAVIPFDELERYEGRYIDGILGHEFFRRLVVTIDYEHKLLHLFDASTYQHAGDDAPISFTLESGMPSLEIEYQIGACPTLKGKFLLDTGARSALDINSPVVTANNLIDCAGKSLCGSLGLGVGGASKQVLTRASYFIFGGHRFENVVTSLEQDKAGSMASKQRDGLVGGGIFKRFTMTLDYSRQNLYVTPNAAYTEPSEYDMSGLLLMSTGDDMKGITVSKVLTGSASERAGILPSDELVTINDQPVGTFTLDRVRELLRQPETNVKLRVRRGEGEQAVTLQLERMI